MLDPLKWQKPTCERAFLLFRGAIGERESPRIVGKEQPVTTATPAAQGNARHQREAFTFDRFIKGEGNQLACSVCEAVADRPGGTYNPLFIHGQVGLGKTHLLRAIAHAAQAGQAGQAGQASRAIYLTSERFAIDLVQAIRRSRTAEFRQVYRHADILLIDDVHFLENKDGIEEELFHTFNALYEQGKQIVLSSDRPPEELRNMQSRLVSRFQGGMVVGIQPPTYDVRLAILRAKAAADRVEVADGVLEAIARRVTANVRVLEGALVRVAAYADLCGERLTADRVEALITDAGRAPQPLSLDLIKAEVAKHYGLEPSRLDSKARDKRTTQVRQIAMYLARELTGSSYPAIGQAFGGRDHSTAMHACHRAETLLEAELFRSDIGQLTARLRSLELDGQAVA
jgi:chromosomal replication initiator protein